MSSLQRSQSVAHDLDIRPLAGRIGAEIDGVQLAGDLPEATIAAIEAALAKYKVILFEIFQSHITQPDNTVRWRWNAGDVAIWDNTATQHCAINDYGDQKRVVRRATINGEVPISVDGRTSVTRRKTTKPAAADLKQTAAA